MSDSSRRSALGWAFVAVLALVLGGVALSLADRGVDRASKTAHLTVPGIADASPIPPRAILGTGELFAADSSAGGGPDLWSFTRVGATLHVQRWTVTPSTVTSQPASLCTSPPAGRLYVAVASWPGASRRVFVFAAERRGSLVVQVRSAAPSCAVLAHARTPALPLRIGDTRAIFAGKDSRGYAELIVVDRPTTTAGVMRIRVLKGEAGFHSVTRDVQLGGANSWPRSKWNVAVGGVNSASGDLLFISEKQPTRTGKIEVHTLLSSRDYSGYGTQIPIDSPEGAGDWSYVLAHNLDGAPVLYRIDPITRQLMRFTL
jgi:hypothetical protein